MKIMVLCLRKECVVRLGLKDKELLKWFLEDWNMWKRLGVKVMLKIKLKLGQWHEIRLKFMMRKGSGNESNG